MTEASTGKRVLVGCAVLVAVCAGSTALCLLLALGLVWFVAGNGTQHEVTRIIPDLPIEHQPIEELIWIRGPFLDHPAPHPWLVVHGHTALKHPRHFGNRIDLDGGAGWGRPLCPAVFEGRDCWLLTDRGRVPLPPP